MALSDFRTDGKTALITGATGLLGREHARALLEIGARVVLTDIDSKALQLVESELKDEFGNSRTIACQMDVTSIVDLRAVLENLRARELVVDILINNAAVNPKVNGGTGIQESLRLENFSIECWEQHLNVGLTGAFLCCQVFGSDMARENRGGVILNIASDLSVIAPNQDLYGKLGVAASEQPVKPITYSVVKTGLIGLTRYIATYWPNCNVRCNALSPGGVYTDQDEEFVTKLNRLIPLQRMAKPDEYRAAVQFLCSDASSYMTGQNIVMDGGRSVW